ncbi:MAG: hypothetical protein OXI81_15820 [Paracoccaceae bacterium]|nr:hypothetical protein [Paracoccaceae bacterium]MDE2911961.1 hypothetical protein [Paracoccaceae bacterium]
MARVKSFRFLFAADRHGRFDSDDRVGLKLTDQNVERGGGHLDVPFGGLDPDGVTVDLRQAVARDRPAAPGAFGTQGIAMSVPLLAGMSARTEFT